MEDPMQLIVVRRRDLSVPVDVATLEMRIRRGILDCSLAGRAGMRSGWVWWHSLSSTGFQASFYRQKFSVEILADLTAGENETRLVIRLGVTRGGGIILAVACAYFVALGLMTHSWVAIGFLAILVLIHAWLAYCAIAVATTFVDCKLIPALSAPIRPGGEPQLPKDYGQVPWRPWNWVPAHGTQAAPPK